MDLGTRVRQERARLGLTREELVARMPAAHRMDPNTLWYIESGRTPDPRGSHVKALAQALQVSTDYLFGLATYPTPAAPRPRRAPRQRPSSVEA